ncbi:MAG: hypothetical protein WA936_12620, partial [Erythrobacter sp.]|uniref:DUF4139 domain-containing protein n=1 Tax=Erythrobacter sp. TaxID=1042 RepID=UPI003C71BB15
MRSRHLLSILLMLAVASPTMARERAVVTSDGLRSVEVSLYRDSSRSPERAIDRDRPEGFALIRETRQVTLPSGPATIRFEGVASGIEPASALVRGLGIEEKNQDANLLSQRGLLDNFTGQSVILRRFDPATGTYSEERAVIRSGADRLIVQTDDGFEAVECTGLDQTLIFDRKPEDLSAKPTLSVEVADQPGGEYEITLTYLADGFDWQANYVAELNADASAIDLRGWMTMVSGDATSFANADANAIAGRVFREENNANTLYADGQRPVSYTCWPSARTHDVARWPPPVGRAYAMRAAPVSDMMMNEAMIVVTASRVATREELGDLKLYRIPFATTIAANSQKQVAFLDKQGVSGDLLYLAKVYGEPADTIQRIFRVENTTAQGLGEPLPSGQIAFFQRALGLRQLVGEDVT